MNPNMMAALHEALAIICEEGLDNTWKRHKICNEMLWKGAENLGLKLVIKQDNRLHGITLIDVPEDIPIQALLHHLATK